MSDQPKYPDKCPKCGKDMEVAGLVRSYPPKQLEQVPGCGTRWECPHCKTPVGGQGGPQPRLIEFEESDAEYLRRMSRCD